MFRKIKDNITNHFKSTEITISHQKYVEIINDYGDTLDECFAAIIYEFEEKGITLMIMILRFMNNIVRLQVTFLHY